MAHTPEQSKAKRERERTILAQGAYSDSEDDLIHASSRGGLWGGREVPGCASGTPLGPPRSSLQVTSPARVLREP